MSRVIFWIVIIMVVSVFIFGTYGVVRHDFGLDPSSCTEWIQISEDYTVSSSGCYRVVADINTITIDNTAQYDSPVFVDLNGHFVDEVSVSEIIQYFNLDFMIFGGDVRRFSNIMLGTNRIFYVFDVNMAQEGARSLYLFGQGDAILEDVTVPFSAIKLEPSNVEMNRVNVSTLEVSVSGDARIHNVSVSNSAEVVVGGDLELVDVNFPEATLVGNEAGEGFVFDNVRVAGILAEYNPTTINVDGVYFVKSIEYWNFADRVYFLNILGDANGSVENIGADILSIGFLPEEIRAVDANCVYMAGSFMEGLPNVYYTYIGSWDTGGFELPSGSLWNVVYSNVPVRNLQSFADELNLEGSVLRVESGWLTIYKSVSIFGGELWVERIGTSLNPSVREMNFFNSIFYSPSAQIKFVLRGPWRISLYSTHFVADGDYTIEIKNNGNDVNFLLESTTVDAPQVYVSCDGAEVTVILEGSTPSDKFVIEDTCIVVDNTTGGSSGGEEDGEDSNNNQGNNDQNSSEQGSGGNGEGGGGNEESAGKVESSVQPASPTVAPDATHNLTTYIVIGIVAVFVALYLQHRRAQITRT